MLGNRGEFGTNRENGRLFPFFFFYSPLPHFMSLSVGLVLCIKVYCVEKGGQIQGHWAGENRRMRVCE